jgi:hypothetical protein
MNLRYAADKSAAFGLGVASIGIGLTEIAAPKVVQDMLGIEDSDEHRGILRALGVREVMHGVGILANGCPNKLAAGVWSRVLGDVLDTALLGIAARKTNNVASFATVAAAVSAIGVMDLVVAKRLSRDAANA